MKYISSIKKVLLNFRETESEIIISKICIKQTNEKELMEVSMTFYEKVDGNLIEIKSFSDNYDRLKVNTLTQEIISANNAIGLFDLNELLMLQIAIKIIDDSKETNEYLGLSSSDLQIIED